MVEMIRERQAAVDKVERHDLFSSLLESNDHDLDLETLSEDEIISMLLILHLLIILTWFLMS
jgi:cytochrome P450